MNLTSDQLHKLRLLYIEKLRSLGVQPKKGNTAMNEDMDFQAHALWMLYQCESTVDQADKVNRWIGFVQACLAFTRVYTIDEMREHVRNL